MTDQLAREMALETAQSFIVQAPAGSGKTELLTQRCLALLAIVDEPEEVLALTFTNKAAAEMRERLAEALALVDVEEHTLAPHKQVTQSLAKQVRERSDSREWQLHDSLHRLRVMTVDAFNLQLVGRNPISAGTYGQPEPLDHEGAWQCYREAASRVLDWLAESEDPADAVRMVFSHIDYNASRWVRELSTLLAVRDQWLPLTGVPDKSSVEHLRKQIELALQRLIRSQLSDLTEHFDATDLVLVEQLLSGAKQRLMKSGRDGPAVAWQDDLSLNQDPQNLGQWQVLAATWLTAKHEPRKRLDVKVGFQKSASQVDFDAMLALLGRYSSDSQVVKLLAQIQNSPPATIDDAHFERFVALLRVLPLAVVELRGLFSQLRQTDFVEIAMAADRLLGDHHGPSELGMILDYQISHILVDEMQDTSAAQYRLLRRLTAGWEPDDGRSLFVVGDPMQSIYAFRQAEVGLFVQAMEGRLGSVTLQPLTLSRNFRSAPTLVEWCNHLFARIFPVRHDASQGRVAFTPSESAVEANAAAYVKLVGVEDGDSRAEAEGVVAEVQSALDAGSATVAVLVRNRNHLRAILPALRHSDVAFRTEGLDRLIDRAEIQDLYALTMALLVEHDRLSWVSLLRGPWVGLSLHELETWLGDDRVSTIWERLNAADVLARLDPKHHSAIHNLRATLATARSSEHRDFVDRLEQAWHSLGMPASYGDQNAASQCYQFFALLRRLQVEKTGFEPSRLAAALTEEPAIDKLQEDVRVVVMTIHKSKGLEFETVILPGLGRLPGRSNKRLMYWHSVIGDEGESTPLISMAASRDTAEEDQLHRYLGDIRNNRGRDELDRLLYVAMTRARHRLVLFASIQHDAQGEIRAPDARTLQSRVWQVLEADFVADVLPAEEAVVSSERVAVSRRYAEPYQHSITEAIRPRPPLQLQIAETEIEYSWVGNLGRSLGTAVHRWLQRLGRFATTEEAQVFHAQSTKIWQRLLSASGVRPEDEAQANQRFQQAITAFFEDPRATWILWGEHQHAMQEYAIESVAEGRLRRIVIDRVLVDKDGDHWLIDYKTSSREGGDVEGFIQQEVERYQAQMATYSANYHTLTGVSPRIALYFPLLRHFEELRLD